MLTFEALGKFEDALQDAIDELPDPETQAPDTIHGNLIGDHDDIITKHIAHCYSTEGSKMNDAHIEKIVKYRQAVNADNWQRISSAIRACPRQGIASYLHPLGARPEAI